VQVCAGSQAPAWEPRPRSSSFKDIGKTKALRTLTERESRARKRDGMRYQAGTAVPKLELGNERSSSRRSQAPAWEPSPRSSSFKDTGKARALRTLTEREYRARKRDGMRYQAGTAVPKLELGNERSSSRRSQAGAWERAGARERADERSHENEQNNRINILKSRIQPCLEAAIEC